MHTRHNRSIDLCAYIYDLAKTLIYVKLISLPPFISTRVLIEALYATEALIMIFLSLDVPTSVLCFYLLLCDSS